MFVPWALQLRILRPSLSPCHLVIYVISKTEVITTKLVCWLFLCRGKQKWSLCFMPLMISNMISFILDGANYIAPLHMFSPLPQMRRFAYFLYALQTTTLLLLYTAWTKRKSEYCRIFLILCLVLTRDSAFQILGFQLWDKIFLFNVKQQISFSFPWFPCYLPKPQIFAVDYHISSKKKKKKDVWETLKKKTK